MPQKRDKLEPWLIALMILLAIGAACVVALDWIEATAIG